MIAIGFEPMTVCLEGRCSIQLSYATIIVGVAGFEPATSASQTRRDNRATLHPENGYLKFCGETGIRTLATVTRRQISNLLHYHSGTSPKKYVYELIFASANVTLEMHLHNIFQFFLNKILS